MTGIYRLMGAVASVFFACGFSHAAAPPNDDWAERSIITELPFSDTVAGIKDATTRDTDPNIFCWFYSTDASNPGRYSVWYGFTTGNEEEYVDLDTNGYDTIIAIYEGAPSTFVGVRAGCNDDGAGFGSGSVLRGVRLRANTAYSIVVSSYTSSGNIGEASLEFSMSRSVVYRVTKTEDGNDGSCDADCSLREAIQQSIAQPGAVLIPAGTYAVPGGLDFGKPNSGGGNLYGAGMADTVIDAVEQGRVVTFPFQENPIRIPTFGLHDLTLTNGRSATNGGALLVGYAYLVLDRVALTKSIAQTNGGGIAVQGAVSFFETLVADNRAMESGGGMYMKRDNLEIYDSTFTGNESLGTTNASGGGALYLEDIFTELGLVNTTISGNRAASRAGGIYLGGVGTARMNNVSIANNTFGGEGIELGAGGLLIGGWNYDTKITNSVLSGNHAAADPENASDCEMRAAGSDQYPLVTNHNLVQMPGNCGFSAPSDLIGVDPLLSPLGRYDSRLPIHVPSDGSPLIDSGDSADGCASVDARGMRRPQDGDGDGTARCDIGAVELADAIDDRIFTDGFDR